MCDFTSRCSAVVLIILFSQNIYAENTSHDTGNNLEHDRELCPAGDNLSTKHVKPRAFSTENIDNTEISADFTKSSRDGSTSLDGNVVIEQHLLRITADHADYDKQQDVLTFSGNVHIDTDSLSLEADAGTVNLDDTGKRGKFNDIKFFIPDSNMKG